MARRSTLASLPAPIVQACNDLIRDGHTIDAIVAALHGLGAPVSRSAVGRYVKSARESMEKYRQAQEVARVWLDKLEAEPQGDVARLLPEMLRAAAFQSISRLGEEGGPVKAADLMLLARTLRDLAGASKTNIDVQLQLRKLREQVQQRAGDAARDVESLTRQAGMSEALVRSIRERILGVGEHA